MNASHTGTGAFETFIAHEALGHVHGARRDHERAHDALRAMRACVPSSTMQSRVPGAKGRRTAPSSRGPREPCDRPAALLSRYRAAPSPLPIEVPRIAMIAAD
jgi:hypothetical protein